MVPSQDDVRSVRRKQLSQLSLVCRNWSRAIRPKLFLPLYISSLEDIRFTSAMLRSRVSAWLAPHITHVVLYRTSRNRLLDPPIWKGLLYLLPHLRVLEFNWNNFNDNKTGLPDLKSPSLFENGQALFPWKERPFMRTLRSLRSVELESFRFTSFSAFFKVLAAIPLLQRLSLWQVKWAEHESDHANLAVQHANDFKRLVYVHAESCTSNISCMWLFAAKFAYNSPSGAPEESRMMIKLLDTLLTTELEQEQYLPGLPTSAVTLKTVRTSEGEYAL